MSLAQWPLSKLTGTIACACGRTHALETKAAAVVNDAPERLAQALEEERAAGGMLLVCDKNTYEVLGKSAASTLRSVGPLQVLMLRGDNLHADEEAVGAALIASPREAKRIVAVGSGTINDIARFVASRVGTAYDVLGTAPSMDGFVSTVSPLIRRGFKVTFEAIAPEHAFLDLAAMKDSPGPMIAAGLGDILGKYTALADWSLAETVWGEYRCAETAALMRRAVDTCAAQANKLPSRSEKAIRGLGEGLLLSGMAMQMVGNSRPASGAEHHLAHFWEITMLARGEKPTLHGDKVGYAALLVLAYYRRFFERIRPFADNDPAAWLAGVRNAYGPIADEVLASSVPGGAPASVLRERALAKWEELRSIADLIVPLSSSVAAMLKACGGPTSANELGLSKDDVRNALLYAKEIRPRPTIMRLGFAWGTHREICEEIVEEFYGR